MSTAQATPLILASAGTTAAPAAQTTVATTAAKGKGGFSEKPTVGELAEFQVTGLLVVFVVLGSITAISGLMSWLLKILAPSQYYGKATPAKAAAAAPAAVKTVAAPAGGLSQDKLIVLLAAAAQEVLGKSVAVVSFRPLDNMDYTWSIQGRVSHHSSHSPRV